MPDMLHVVQAFNEVDGELVPVEPVMRDSAGSAKALAQRLALSHAGVIAWSRTADPDRGEYGAPEIIFQAGRVPDEME